MKSRQGRIFRIRLSDRSLSMWGLGLIPLAWVPLESIRSIEQRGLSEFWSLHPRRVLLPWRYWYWPSLPPRKSRAPGHFLIQTRFGVKIWVRLRSGMHYQLREAVHRRQTGLD